jgi:hypothetical protein
MSSILALSVTDKIEQYGAYAGFASVLGLAVLSLLYFAQAREVKRLREWAGRAPERALDDQQRAIAAAQQRVIAQPQRPAQPAPPQPGQPAAAPGAPGARPAAATPAGQAAGGVGAAPAAAAATAAGAATATPRPAVGVGGSASPASPNGPAGQPTTVQPAANGAAAADQPTQPPVRPGQPLRVPPGAGTPPSRSALPPEDDDEPRSRTALFAAIGALVAVIAVVVILVTGVFGGDDNPTQKANTIAPSASTTPKGTSTTKGKAQPAAAPRAGTYTVAVLNGTTVPGLARGVANRLTEAKHKIGNVTNAATQDRSATQIEFAPGHRAEADAVAKVIDVGSDAIIPLTAGSKTIAGDQATVVVTVGADQNTSPQQQTTTP